MFNITEIMLGVQTADKSIPTSTRLLSNLIYINT